MKYIGKTYNKEEALEYGKLILERACAHQSYIAYRRGHIESMRFYDGDKVFLDQDLLKMIAKHIQPISANIIAPIIDSIMGNELQSRFRIKVQVDSEIDEATRLSAAITSFLTKVQQDTGADKENTKALKDALIGGMGWMNIFNKDNKTKMEHIHPLEIIPDFNDISDQFTKMDYVIRLHFLTEEEIRMRWGKKADEINFSSFSPSYSSSYTVSPAIQNLSAESPIIEAVGDMNCVCEVQFKVPKKAFRGTTKDGRLFETFDLDKAEEVIEQGGELEKIDAKEIRQLFFCQNTILQYNPLNPSYPTQQDFSYIPIIFKKRGSDNVPYGMIENLKAMQIDLNARLTKMIRHFIAQKLIVNNFNKDDRSIEEIREQWTNPNGVIFLEGNEQVTVHNSTEMGDNQMKAIESYINLVKRSSGVEDEARGIPTNATSGVSQRIRQAASDKTNAFISDNFYVFKERQGKQLVNILQYSFLENVYVLLEEDEDKEVLYLNFSYQDMIGNVHVANNVNFIPFSIVIDEIPNFKTSLDEKRNAIESIAQLPFQELIWVSEELLKLYTDKPKKLKAEMVEAFKMKAMLQNPEAFQGQQLPQDQPPQPQGQPQ